MPETSNGVIPGRLTYQSMTDAGLIAYSVDHEIGTVVEAVTTDQVEIRPEQFAARIMIDTLLFRVEPWLLPTIAIELAELIRYEREVHETRQSKRFSPPTARMVDGIVI